MHFFYDYLPSRTLSADREWRASKHAILAYHVGGWREGESPLYALARALDIAPDNLLAELEAHSIEKDELELLSGCLEMNRLDLSNLSIQEALWHMVELVNEMLAQVPSEVRYYFRAPGRLKFRLFHKKTRSRRLLISHEA